MLFQKKIHQVTNVRAHDLAFLRSLPAVSCESSRCSMDGLLARESPKWSTRNTHHLHRLITTGAAGRGRGLEEGTKKSRCAKYKFSLRKEAWEKHMILI